MSGAFLKDVYIRTRGKVPNGIVSALKRISILRRFACVFQPAPGSIEPYKLGHPLDGLVMNVPSNWVYPMVWGKYEEEVCRLLAEHTKPGWTVIDAGAHIGYFTLLMARLVGETGMVLSFEPLSENLSILHRNISINHMEKVVNIVPMALAERTGLTRLFRHETTSQGYLENVPQEVRERGTWEVVSAAALDDYLNLLGRPRIHLVKMDVEGAESLAIMGMKETLRRDAPVVLLESHGENARHGLDFLIKLGYSCKRVCGAGTTSMPDIESYELKNEHWLLLP